MNRVELTGRIANDLELKKTNSNKSVLTFNLAVAKNKDITDFIKIQTWEQRAEYLNNYAFKGVLIECTGRIETSSYNDKNGNRVKDTYVVADQVSILSKPDTSKMGSRVEFDEEDLPFM